MKRDGSELLAGLDIGGATCLVGVEGVSVLGLSGEERVLERPLGGPLERPLDVGRTSGRGVEVVGGATCNRKEPKSTTDQ